LFLRRKQAPPGQRRLLPIRELYICLYICLLSTDFEKLYINYITA